MTAYAMQGDREKCLAAGMDEYLSKPARPAEIIAMLNKMALGHAAESPIEQSCTPGLTDQSNTDTTVPVFDRNELLERLGGHEEVLARFIGMFTSNVVGYMELLLTAVECCDGEQVRIQAHTIKGAAANIAAHRVRETASAIETLARERRLNEATGLVQQLRNDIEEFSNDAAVHGII
jgi:HPt (histidine-containing phosphotransfer) domain-containing protein